MNKVVLIYCYGKATPIQVLVPEKETRSYIAQKKKGMLFKSAEVVDDVPNRNEPLFNTKGKILKAYSLYSD